MTVAELITLLQTMPQEKQVVYVNTCADNGDDVIIIDEARLKAGGKEGWGLPTYPPDGVVLLI